MISARAVSHWLLILFDLGILVVVPFLTVLLLNDFALSSLLPAKSAVLNTYVVSCAGVGVLIWFSTGVGRRIWSRTSLQDVLRVVSACTLTILLAALLTFMTTRLAGLSRAIIVMHLLISPAAMISLRVIARVVNSPAAKAAPFASARGLPTVRHVLMIGSGPLAELYNRAARSVVGNTIEVVGVLDDDKALHGRVACGLPVLGGPSEVDRVVERLRVHGVDIDAIVVVKPQSDLSPALRNALAGIESGGRIAVENLAERLGFTVSRDDGVTYQPISSTPMRHRPYWGKRAMDFGLAVILLIVLSPLMLLVSLLVAIDVGIPVLFWQQRPGTNGWPFRINKFRTMRMPIDADGVRISDGDRLSAIGRNLRRFKLDELPQLWNVLIGEMSFVGPRPLLPNDQPDKAAARLAVRPGVTGWAQVNGGTLLTVSEKNMLDRWYVRHASPALDVRIASRTVATAIWGERRNPMEIAMAQMDLECEGRHPMISCQAASETAA